VTNIGGKVTKEMFVAVEAEKTGSRRKVPFEKGYSQMDWIRLSNKRPAIPSSILNEVTMEEVMKHNTEEDGWTVIDGKVFDISDYLKYHPGGAAILKLALGKDCTVLFRKYHAWVNYEMLLEKYVVGYLSPDDHFS
jgi:cytochrome b involved in lipid metabolism